VPQHIWLSRRGRGAGPGERIAKYYVEVSGGPALGVLYLGPGLWARDRPSELCPRRASITSLEPPR
jgi:hypothetical protein